MDDSTPPQSENDWTVIISVREREGQTEATARLRFGDHESVGVGLSRLGAYRARRRRYRRRTGSCAGCLGSRAAADGPYRLRWRAKSSTRSFEFSEYSLDRRRHSRGDGRRKADAITDIDDVDPEHHQPAG